MGHQILFLQAGRVTLLVTFVTILYSKSAEDDSSQITIGPL